MSNPILGQESPSGTNWPNTGVRFASSLSGLQSAQGVSTAALETEAGHGAPAVAWPAAARRTVQKSPCNTPQRAGATLSGDCHYAGESKKSQLGLCTEFCHPHQLGHTDLTTLAGKEGNTKAKTCSPARHPCTTTFRARCSHSSKACTSDSIPIQPTNICSGL